MDIHCSFRLAARAVVAAFLAGATVGAAVTIGTVDLPTLPSAQESAVQDSPR